MSKSRKLIDQLSDGLTPVQPLATPFWRGMRWILLACLLVLACSLIEGWRYDWMLRMLTPIFILELILTLLAGATAALAACYLSVPSSTPRRWLWGLTALPILFWLSFLAVIIGQGPVVMLSEIRHEITHGYDLWRLFAYGFLPGILMVLMIKRAAPLHPGLVGLMAVIAISSMSAIGCRLVCPLDGPLHLLTWHILPILICGLLGVVIGKLLLKFR